MIYVCGENLTTLTQETELLYRENEEKLEDIRRGIEKNQERIENHERKLVEDRESSKNMRSEYKSRLDEAHRIHNTMIEAFKKQDEVMDCLHGRLDIINNTTDSYTPSSWPIIPPVPIDKKGWHRLPKWAQYMIITGIAIVALGILCGVAACIILPICL